MPPAIVELILSNSGSRSLCTLASSVHKGSHALPSSSELVRELGLILGDENEHLVPCRASKKDNDRMPPEKIFFFLFLLTSASELQSWPSGRIQEDHSLNDLVQAAWVFIL